MNLGLRILLVGIKQNVCIIYLYNKRETACHYNATLPTGIICRLIVILTDEMLPRLLILFLYQNQNLRDRLIHEFDGCG